MPDPLLLELVQKPTIEEVMAVLKQPLPRRYRIDVETEDTLEPDIDADRQRAVELAQGIAQIAPAVPAIDMAFGPGFAKEMIALTMRKFHTGKQLDDILDKALALPPMPMMPPQAPQEGQQGNAP